MLRRVGLPAGGQTEGKAESGAAAGQPHRLPRPLPAQNGGRQNIQQLRGREVADRRPLLLPGPQRDAGADDGGKNPRQSQQRSGTTGGSRVQAKVESPGESDRGGGRPIVSGRSAGGGPFLLKEQDKDLRKPVLAADGPDVLRRGQEEELHQLLRAPRVPCRVVHGCRGQQLLNVPQQNRTER